MNTKKKLFTSLTIATMFISCLSATATATTLSNQNVGVIDINYILINSKQTQALKQKQEALTIELQKYGITEKEKMMNNSKTDLSKVDLEKELVKKVSLKKDNLEKEYRDNFINVQQKIRTAVGSVEKKKHVELVFTKDSLILGGTDITKDVLEALDSIK